MGRAIQLPGSRGVSQVYSTPAQVLYVGVGRRRRRILGQAEHISAQLLELGDDAVDPLKQPAGAHFPAAAGSSVLTLNTRSRFACGGMTSSGMPAQRRQAK